jgi:hypothetical protein
VRRYVAGVKFKPNDESFGWCAWMTVTEHTVGDETDPLAVQSAEVSPKSCAGVLVTARSGVRKKQMVSAPTAPRHVKRSFSATEKPLQSQMEIFARKHLQIVLPKSICEVAATSMVSFRVV